MTVIWPMKIMWSDKDMVPRTRLDIIYINHLFHTHDHTICTKMVYSIKIGIKNITDKFTGYNNIYTYNVNLNTLHFSNIT